MNRRVVRDRRTAAIAAATGAALVAMELADTRSRTAGSDRVRDEGTATRFGAAMAVALGTTAASLLRRGARPLPRGDASFRAGVATTWAGVALNRWSRRTLARNYRSLLTVVDDHEVVDRGPYRAVRHPMYLGSCFICAGLATALRTPAAAVAWALPPAALVHRIRVEERMLRDALGDRYASFESGRARLLPGVW